MYTFVGNSPNNLIDPLGLKVGDKYINPDCAGWNAVQDILLITKSTGLEHGGFIYENSDGTYSYSFPITGTPIALPRRDFYNIPTPAGSNKYGWYHTHPQVPGAINNQFSPGDKDISNHLDGTGVGYPIL